MVTQASSPYFARTAFWSIAATMAESGLHVLPYHTLVPSFGEWGFVAGYAGGEREVAELTFAVMTCALSPRSSSVTCRSFPPT